MYIAKIKEEASMMLNLDIQYGVGPLIKYSKKGGGTIDKTAESKARLLGMLREFFRMSDI
jgi:hypothetical protein